MAWAHMGPSWRYEPNGHAPQLFLLGRGEWLLTSVGGHSEVNPRDQRAFRSIERQIKVAGGDEGPILELPRLTRSDRHSKTLTIVEKHAERSVFKDDELMDNIEGSLKEALAEPHVERRRGWILGEPKEDIGDRWWETYQATQHIDVVPSRGPPQPKAKTSKLHLEADKLCNFDVENGWRVP